MTYDSWKCTPPAEDLELEVCGHVIGSCDCDQRPLSCTCGECLACWEREERELTAGEGLK